MKKMTFAAALLAATALSGVASAKTLVYCSEGSPEGFDPALYTAGTTFDASSRPVYNRLLEFEPGTTNPVPALAESYEVSDDGLQYTFKLRPGVKFQTTDFFTPTRDHERGRRDLLLRAPAQGRPPLAPVCRRCGVGILQRHGLPGPDRLDREGRRHDGEVHAEAEGSALHRQPRHGLRVDHVEGVRRQARGRRQEGTAEPDAGRHRPVRLRRLPAGRGHPLQGQCRLLGRQGEDRRSRLRHHDRRRRPPAEAEGRRMPCHAVSERGRRRRP